MLYLFKKNEVIKRDINQKQYKKQQFNPYLFRVSAKTNIRNKK